MIDINMLLTRVMQHDHELRSARKLAAKLGLDAASRPAEDAPPLAYTFPPLEEGMLIGIVQPFVAGLSDEEAKLHDQRWSASLPVRPEQPARFFQNHVGFFYHHEQNHVCATRLRRCC